MQPPRRFAPPPLIKPAAPRPAPGALQQRAGGFRVTVGSYMHRGVGSQNLPPELSGHAFVAIEQPGGRRQAWGFSPAAYQGYDPRRDLPKLTAGVRGRVHADDGAFAKPGVRTQSFDVSPAQARAALAKVAEYRTRTPDFSLARRQCSSFATDVLRAAEIDAFPGAGVRRPQQIYDQMQRPLPPTRRR